MLVLSRKKNETIKVGDVIFKICRVHRSFVSVGIQAPKHMRISRGELDGPDDALDPTPDSDSTPPAAVPAGLVPVA